jgi:hypothetical protein
LNEGHFLTVLPRSVFATYADRFSLKALPVRIRDWPVQVALAILKARASTPVVQLFIEHLRTVSNAIAQRLLNSNWSR